MLRLNLKEQDWTKKSLIAIWRPKLYMKTCVVVFYFSYRNKMIASKKIYSKFSHHNTPPPLNFFSKITYLAVEGTSMPNEDDAILGIQISQHTPSNNVLWYQLGVNIWELYYIILLYYTNSHKCYNLGTTIIFHVSSKALI